MVYHRKIHHRIILGIISLTFITICLNFPNRRMQIYYHFFYGIWGQQVLVSIKDIY
jgi:hypothetical protein